MEAPWVQPREDSHGIPMVIPMRIPMVIPMRIPTGFLWEWELKFYSHGNPGTY